GGVSPVSPFPYQPAAARRALPAPARPTPSGAVSPGLSRTSETHSFGRRLAGPSRTSETPSFGRRLAGLSSPSRGRPGRTTGRRREGGYSSRAPARFFRAH